MGVHTRAKNMHKTIWLLWKRSIHRKKWTEISLVSKKSRELFNVFLFGVFWSLLKIDLLLGNKNRTQKLTRLKPCWRQANVLSRHDVTSPHRIVRSSQTFFTFKQQLESLRIRKQGRPFKSIHKKKWTFTTIGTSWGCVEVVVLALNSVDTPVRILLIMKPL